MSRIASLQKWLQRKHYRMDLNTVAYMMTPGEKFVYYSILFLLCSLTFIAIVLYLPHHISFLVGRAWYYINGENIEVEEMVREMSASMVHETATATGVEVLQDAAHAVVKEL